MTQRGRCSPATDELTWRIPAPDGHDLVITRSTFEHIRDGHLPGLNDALIDASSSVVTDIVREACDATIAVTKLGAASWAGERAEMYPPSWLYIFDIEQLSVSRVERSLAEIRSRDRQWRRGDLGVLVAAPTFDTEGSHRFVRTLFPADKSLRRYLAGEIDIPRPQPHRAGRFEPLRDVEWPDPVPPDLEARMRFPPR